MTIKYLGHSSFFIKGKEGRVVTDPYDDKVGLKFPKSEADIVTISHHHKDHDYARAIGGDPLVVDYPGEYEKMGIRVTGFKGFHDNKKGEERGENILYKVEAENITVLHCGDLGEVPSDDFIDELGEVDILLVPVGGFYTIDAKEAAALVHKVEPSIVIPMHYKTKHHNEQVFGKLSPVEEFIKEIGLEPPEPQPQLTLKKEELIGEMKVVVMDPAN